MIPVILSGGSGTRLWPLSREAYPKQFLSLVGEDSMLQATWGRVAPGVARADRGRG
jgi:mannose-1-phosphate guanylyltransferase/mannose-6-phosphate isomerase